MVHIVTSLSTKRLLTMQLTHTGKTLVDVSHVYIRHYNHLIHSPAALIRPEVVGAQPVQGDETRVTVENDLGNISFQCILKAPATLNELTTLLAKAKQENQTIKPAGSMHAWSWVSTHLYRVIECIV